MLLRVLGERQYDLLIAVLEAADRVQHLFWGQDEILRCYRRLDETIGLVRAQLDAQDTLLILLRSRFQVRASLAASEQLAQGGGLSSDHADRPDRLAAHARLRHRFEQDLYQSARARTPGHRRAGAASSRSVPRDRGQAIGVRDESGESIVQQVYFSREIYSGDKLAEAGDLVIGLRAGYRTSSQTALGRLGEAVITENRKKWAADHCSVDPALVPGVLLCNRLLDSDDPSILDFAPTILPPAGRARGRRDGWTFTDQRIAEAKLPREYPEAPIVGVGALVLRDDQILLIRRAKEPDKGRCPSPAGAWSWARRYRRRRGERSARNAG